MTAIAIEHINSNFIRKIRIGVASTLPNVRSISGFFRYAGYFVTPGRRLLLCYVPI